MWCQVVTALACVLLATGVGRADPFFASSNVNLVFWPGITMTDGGNGGSPASNLTNKYVESFWNYNSGANLTSSWVQCDLGMTQSIYRIRFKTWSGQAAPEYRIWVGTDTSGFTNGADIVHRTTCTTITNEETFAPVAGRYVRIWQQHTTINTWYNMSQLAIYSTDSKEMIYAYPISETGADGAVVSDPDSRWDNWSGLDANAERGLFAEHKATDSDSNCWAPRAKANLSTTNAILTLQFNRGYMVSKFVMSEYLNSGLAATNAFRIGFSDTGAADSYADVVSTNLSPFKQIWTFTFPSTHARYARVFVGQQGNSVLFYRMEFYGALPPKGSMIFLK